MLPNHFCMDARSGVSLRSRFLKSRWTLVHEFVLAYSITLGTRFASRGGHSAGILRLRTYGHGVRFCLFCFIRARKSSSLWYTPFLNIAQLDGELK
jgi:hypothetical protein